MKDKFIGFYRPSEEEFVDIWKNCIFIFDANVLLNLYRYPKETKEEFIRVIEGIVERVWLPHQAALEYQRNRLTVIAEQINKYSEVKKILQDTEDSLCNKFTQLQLRKRHSYINEEKFLDNIKHVFKEFIEEICKLEEQEAPSKILNPRLLGTK